MKKELHSIIQTMEALIQFIDGSKNGKQFDKHSDDYGFEPKMLLLKSFSNNYC